MHLDELHGAYRALRTLQAPEQVVYDPVEKRWKASDGAFRTGRDGTISIDLEEALLIDNLPLTHGYPRIGRAVGLIAHNVDRLKEAGFSISHVPLDGNDYHGEARGKLSGSARRDLANTCEIIVSINGDNVQRYKDEQLAKKAQVALTAQQGT